MCSDDNFAPNKWLTMGRLNPEEPPHCPLVGEYTGVIPDAESLCAKSYADCNNPEVSFMQLYHKFFYTIDIFKIIYKCILVTIN